MFTYDSLTAFEHYLFLTMWSYCLVNPDFGNLFSTLNPDQSILWCCQQHKNPCLWCLIQLPPDKLSVPWYNPQQYHSNMIDHVSLHNATGCRCKYKLTSLWKCTRVFPLVSYWSFIGPSATQVASYPHTNSYPHRSQVNTQTHKLHSQCTIARILVWQSW